MQKYVLIMVVLEFPMDTIRRMGEREMHPLFSYC